MKFNKTRETVWKSFNDVVWKLSAQILKDDQDIGSPVTRKLGEGTLLGAQNIMNHYGGRRYAAVWETQVASATCAPGSMSEYW